MNLPNKLCIARALCIPVIVVLLYMDSDTCRILAGALFILAALTDLVDGKIARKYNMITDFGKFADPLADKLLVLSAMICFVQLGFMPAWICIIITAREIAISGLRLVCAGKGVVVAASKLGKFKTVTQMAFIILTSLNLPFYFGTSAPGFCNGVEIFRIIIMYLALLMTIVSFIDYVVKNKDAFSLKDM